MNLAITMHLYRVQSSDFLCFSSNREQKKSFVLHMSKLSLISQSKK